jgi:selenocysteine lyase/cysteine desulfurase
MSIFEHNSNVLAWREAGAKIELIPLTSDGELDMEYFEKVLSKYKDYKSLKVATISAGSNVTGTLIDVDRVAVLCHLYGTLACFDYAAVIPYVSINMNGPTPDMEIYFEPISDTHSNKAYKDAVFFSPHKLVGGP